MVFKWFLTVYASEYFHNLNIFVLCENWLYKAVRCGPIPAFRTDSNPPPVMGEVLELTYIFWQFRVWCCWIFWPRVRFSGTCMDRGPTLLSAFASSMMNLQYLFVSICQHLPKPLIPWVDYVICEQWHLICGWWSVERKKCIQSPAGSRWFLAFKTSWSSQTNHCSYLFPCQCRKVHKLTSF